MKSGLSDFLRIAAKRWFRRSPTLLAIALRLRDPLLHPRLIEPVAGQRVLVLAPHADDEAIGCGGALLRHVAMGSGVSVAYLTDGALGDARLHDAELPPGRRAEIQRWLRSTRKAEAARWCEGAGAEAPMFFDAPDGALRTVEERVATQIGIEMDRIRPDIVYLPSLLDSHVDHVAANRIMARVLSASASRRHVLVRGYEVWNPLVSNALMDVGSVFDRKLELLALHESQTRDIDYGRAVAGLNAYRAIMLPKRTGQAEAFIELRPDAHARLVR